MPRTPFLLPAALLALLTTAAVAQTTPPLPAPGDSATTYYAPDGRKLPTKEGAQYYRVTTMRDTAIGTVREYYPSGKRLAYKFYANVRRHRLDGTALEWYESGQLKRSSRYVLGERHGPTESWYPDGKLRRTELYQADWLLGGHTYAPDGTETKYEPLEQMPQYPGGLEALATDIAANVEYPAKARKKQIEGKVVVKFAVDEQGHIDLATAQVTRSVDPLLDAAALAVLPKLKAFTPGRYDGEPVRIWMAAPVFFKR